ncbi:hypothetical protein LTS18_009761 [Coniosporium uncinatum]|uniref:Uncharacterized protein n=1 Tax=Coniosporium uncinatum TaxID=93489 RepID=A0ACC3DWR9_9PEZI|nr:hypothetical protein LTS18_009761 [Coniosporium uncinatum]
MLPNLPFQLSSRGLSLSLSPQSTISHSRTIFLIHPNHDLSPKRRKESSRQSQSGRHRVSLIVRVLVIGPTLYLFSCLFCGTKELWGTKRERQEMRQWERECSIRRKGGGGLVSCAVAGAEGEEVVGGGRACAATATNDEDDDEHDEDDDEHDEDDDEHDEDDDNDVNGGVRTEMGFPLSAAEYGPPSSACAASKTFT